ncbi:GNAT family N-acetyltransferase [Nostocoides australiense]
MRIRPREDADLPELVEVLTRQQPGSRYPVRWPPPFPAVDFIKRPGELGAWVAVAGGAIPGHVSVMRLPDEPLVTSAGDEAAIWSAGTGLPPHRLASVNALFVDPTAAGQGVGAALHDVAVAAIREAGLVARRAGDLRFGRLQGDNNHAP